MMTLSPAKGTTPPSLYLYRDRQTFAGHCMCHWRGDSRHLAQICMVMVDASQAESARTESRVVE